MLFCIGCGKETPKAQSVLRIAAASDLQIVLPLLLEEFKKKKHDAVWEVTYGSTGILATQIEQGAPHHIFLAADQERPLKLIQQGVTKNDKPIIYAAGRLVAWTEKKNPQDLKTLLLDAEVKKIAIANPEHAPYGKAAVESLQELGLLDAVKPKLVYADNIAQAVMFVQSGNVEVGLIAESLTFTDAMKKGTILQIEAKANRVEQSMVTIKNAPVIAEEFQTFLFSKAATSILKQYGFTTPGEP